MTDARGRISNFHLTGTLYEGRKTDVFEARSSLAGGVVEPAAVKVLRPQYACIGSELRAFLREVAWSTDLEHPGLPRIYEAGEQDGRYYIASELIKGRSVSEILLLLSEEGRSLSIDVACGIVYQLCASLQYLHGLSQDGQLGSVVHLGVCPANVMLRRNGSAVLVDFGSTLSLSENELIELDEEQEAYHAPELMQGTPPTIGADIYSLGKVLKELCLMCSDGSARSAVLAIASQASSVVPEERYRSAMEMSMAIERVAQDHRIDLTQNALANFVTDLLGTMKSRIDPRAARRRSTQAPVRMPSEGLETVVGGPSLAQTFPEPDMMRTPMPSRAAIVPAETVAGGPSASPSVEDEPTLERDRPTPRPAPAAPASAEGSKAKVNLSYLDTVVASKEQARHTKELSVRGQTPPPSTEHEQVTRDTALPDTEAPPRKKGFVDEHMASTVMGTPDQIRHMVQESVRADSSAGERSATEAGAAETSRKKGFPEEMIPTVAYDQIRGKIATPTPSSDQRPRRGTEPMPLDDEDLVEIVE